MRHASRGNSGLIIVAMVGIVLAVGLVMMFLPGHWDAAATRDATAELRRERQRVPRNRIIGRIGLYWETVPEVARQVTWPTGPESNIHPDDYSGPESCRQCHEKNYQDWSKHPHRWMNALADQHTVRGSFSDGASIDYLGGHATFYRANDGYRMELERDGVRRLYNVTQTIGSRFFQYYVGRGIEGPEPEGDSFYAVDHVLPFGYWLDEQMWVPVVHIDAELPDGRRLDPFDLPGSPPAGRLSSHSDVAYTKCNICHTTFPLGDMFVRKQTQLSEYVPVPFAFDVSAYLGEAHPATWDSRRHAADLTDAEVVDILTTVEDYDAPEHSVTLGISCEACHLGCKQHAARQQDKPSFLPRSPHLFASRTGKPMDPGRTHTNVNWVCARCHVGSRPRFAGGMSTWNSTEFADASLGSCYSKLKCVDCHNPHQEIGRKWSLTPDEDDALCLKCHQQFDDADTRREHTHHLTGSSGSRCMNCHMPHLNEGLQDVVRTHTIFSPTRRDMIEANHPNACNLCHLDQSIDWTVNHLKDWYGAGFSGHKISQTYGDRTRPAGEEWMESPSESVRLVGAAAAVRHRSMWALPLLTDMLDDEYLINRQFVQKWLQDMLHIRLSEFGYRFYMTPDERREPLNRVREALLDQ